MKNMNNEFTTYNQALALKELGFDEECFYHYEYHSERLCEDKAFLIAGNGNKYYKDTNMEKSVNAPTFHQAFRFFREKYNIHAEITWSPSYEYNPGEWSDAIYEITFVDVSYTKEWKAESPDMQRSKGKQLTYKEAENACLDKLIEICKTKTND